MICLIQFGGYAIKYLGRENKTITQRLKELTGFPMGEWDKWISPKWHISQFVVGAKLIDKYIWPSIFV